MRYIMGDTKQFLIKLIEKAGTCENQEFTEILSWQEFSFYQTKRNSLRLIIRALNSSAKKLFGTLCSELRTNKRGTSALRACRHLTAVIKFYEHELAVVGDMIQEYKNYLWQGNFLRAWMGELRK